MNRKILSGLIICMVTTGVSWADIRTFEIDPVHSALTFTIRHLYTPFTGRINLIAGTVRMDPDDMSSMKIVAEADAAKIDTANERRDDHLRNPDFFDTPNHPTARFESTRVVPHEDGKSAAVTGNLTIRGTTREVTGRLEFGGYGMDHREGRRIGLLVTGTIQRSAFGVDYNATLPNGMTVLGEDVTLNVAIQAIEADKPNPPTDEDAPSAEKDKPIAAAP